MNIHSEIIRGEQHISVMGLLETEDEQRMLLDVLRERQGTSEIHITFFNAKTLPAVIIESLKFHFDRSPDIPLRLFVLHRRLSLYLTRLGIQNKLVFEKSLAPPPDCGRVEALALGGSAESLDKIFMIIKSLPLADISVFIVQHFPRDAQNILDTLLQEKTPYRTMIPKDRTTVEANVIYIAPADFHMKVEGGMIRLTQDAPVNFARPSIDVLFESLSQEYQGTLLAIILCGYGSDGSHSLKTLQRNGAKIIVEDPLDSSAQEMPKNALQTGCYDYKFPIQETASYVSRTIRKNELTFDEAEVREFLASLHSRYGYDYQEYSLESITRRLQKIMTERRFGQFSIFSAKILQDAELFEELFLEFSINVTHFFRNPDVFRRIREETLPYLDSYAHLKIWCAGCSTGEEPYSLAILLDEAGMLKKSQIYATDINPLVIIEARNGLFPKKDIEIEQQNYRQSGGTGTFLNYFDQFDHLLKVKQHLRDRMLFFQHSLINSGVLNEFQLILCRNVLIYFNPALQRKTFRLFEKSLDRHGFLVLGESETISLQEHEAEFEEFDRKYKIYRKRRSHYAN